MRGWLALALVACRSSTPPEPRVAVEPQPPAVVRDAPAPWRSCLLDGASPCLSGGTPVRVADQLLAWSGWLAEHADRIGRGVTECRWVAELEHVLLCASSDKQAMNPALLRAAIFIENQPRVVVTHDDPIYTQLIERIGGFDLLKRHPAGTHPDLVGYYAAVDQACPRDPAMCNDPAEVAMRALLERAWANRPSFVVLAVAHRGTVAVDEAVSHEILHAQYFTNPRFRKVVEDYWATLSEATRARIRSELGSIYNPKDDELIQNELQAYVLMSGAERSRFSTLLEHRAPLAKLLADRGITPVAVERRADPWSR
jgi:hypothetical protein